MTPNLNKNHHLADDIFVCIFLNENCCISIQVSLQFIPNKPFARYVIFKTFEHVDKEFANG